MKPIATTLNATRPHRIFLVDDHPLLRRCLAQLLTSEPSLEVCGEAATATEALPAVERLQPDLVIVDLSLADGPDGLKLTRNLSGQCQRCRLLMLSSHGESMYARYALEAGAHGYLMKSESTECLFAAIREILNGGIYVSENLKAQWARRADRSGLLNAAASGLFATPAGRAMTISLILFCCSPGTLRAPRMLHHGRNRYEVVHCASAREPGLKSV